MKSMKSILAVGPNPDIVKDKHAFERHIRTFLKKFIGDDADTYTEKDFVSDLAEDGWPDHRKWLEIFCRLDDGGELTERERACALAYYLCEDGDEVPEAYRLP